MAVQRENLPRPNLVLVEADEQKRAALKTTLSILDVQIEEAPSLAIAARRARLRNRAIVVVGENPVGDPVAFCRELGADRRTQGVGVVVAGGADGALRRRALRAASTGLVLRAAAGPLELIEVVEGLLTGRPELRLGATAPTRDDALLSYAHDLRRLLELTRGQRLLLQRAFHQPVDALAGALATKDTGTRAHSQRVEEYAKHLAAAIDPGLLADPGLEAGFLLHDVGKIGIPDRILLKAGPLTPAEQRIMRTHTILGEQMVAEIPLLGGAGRGVVRSHHERWDGQGYPDRLQGDDIPIGARIFAIVDSLDAMTTERPYRRPGSWSEAVAEIEVEGGRQFDPEIVEAFSAIERDLRGIYHDLAAA
jgi:response regulator RpfG family c-di-GMP phosphodiesterase